MRPTPSHPRRLGLLISAALSLAWVRPALPPGSAKPATDSGLTLDYLIVEVNGEARMVKEGSELLILRGDRLLIKEASLVDRALEAKEVNVVGYQGPKSDDRGRVFTTRDLKPKHSEDQKGDVFAVLVSSKKVLHGSVFFRLMDPVLRYAELSINGAKRVMRDGERLTVKAADLVKVERVVTNLEKNDGVLFQIMPVDEKAKDYEIRFQRGGAAFARIPLKIEP